MAIVVEQAQEDVLAGNAQQQAEQDAEHDWDEAGYEGPDDPEDEFDEYDRQPWQSAGYRAVLQTYKYFEGYDAEGYSLLVNPGYQHAMIVKFRHDSCNSTLTGIELSDWEAAEHDRGFIKWQGSYDELFELTEFHLDPKAAHLGRELSPDDYDYECWSELYAAICTWKQAGCPLWKGRPTRSWQHDYSHKTPLSSEVQAAVCIQAAFRAWRSRVRNKAAARIQAAFRAWQFRLKVMYNPQTELGRRYLLACFHKECK